MKRALAFLIVTLTVYSTIRGDVYTDYITTYSEMAIEQQEAYGIPASITLAQGLLESAAGRSTLATKGNNHFGIKCHRTWQGDTLLRSDDAPNECFRAYGSAAESFHDHSRFLLGKRYAPLFELDPFDYAGWATTLRKCGYATDPNYAQRLITIIERYALYLFDSESGRKTDENALFIQQSLAKSHPVRRTRNLHYIIAAPGDTYQSLAKEFNLDVKKLLNYNDATNKKSAIKDWEEVYLEPKHDTAPADLKSIVIGEGESLHSISQRLAVSMATLERLNPHAKDHPGTTLRLH